METLELSWDYNSCFHDFFQPYYEACMFDYCSMPTRDMACDIFATYSLACSKQGVVFDWRSETACQVRILGWFNVLWYVRVFIILRQWPNEVVVLQFFLHCQQRYFFRARKTPCLSPLFVEWFTAVWKKVCIYWVRKKLQIFLRGRFPVTNPWTIPLFSWQRLSCLVPRYLSDA